MLEITPEVAKPLCKQSLAKMEISSKPSKVVIICKLISQSDYLQTPGLLIELGGIGDYL